MSSRLAPTTSEGQKTTERILDAAEALFSERGFAGTAMRDIATQVSLNPASIYNHFDGKQALYEAVLERACAPLFALIREAANVPWTTEHTERTIALVTEFFAKNPNLARLIAHEALTGGTHMRQMIAKQLRPIIAEGFTVLKKGFIEKMWTEEEIPFLFSAFMHITIGPFLLSPIFSIAMESDPFDKETVAKQAAFLRKVSRRLTLPTPADETQSGRPEPMQNDSFPNGA